MVPRPQPVRRLVGPRRSSYSRSPNAHTIVRYPMERARWSPPPPAPALAILHARPPPPVFRPTLQPQPSAPASTAPRLRSPHQAVSTLAGTVRLPRSLTQTRLVDSSYRPTVSVARTSASPAATIPASRTSSMYGLSPSINQDAGGWPPPVRADSRPHRTAHVRGQR